MVGHLTVSQYDETKEEAQNADGSGSGDDEDDIEAQIRKEVEGMKPNDKKPRRIHAIRTDIPCGWLTPQSDGWPS